VGFLFTTVLGNIFTGQVGNILVIYKFVPGGFQDHPEQTRDSVRMLIEDYDIEVLCPNHGAPVTENGRDMLQEALDKDDGR